MKPEKIIFDEPDKMEVVATKPDKTHQMIDSIKPHKGHTLFEINPITGKCRVAEYEKTDINYSEGVDDGGGIRRKVIENKNCVYVSALNKKNALVKFFKTVGKQIQRAQNEKNK